MWKIKCLKSCSYFYNLLKTLSLTDFLLYLPFAPVTDFSQKFSLPCEMSVVFPWMFRALTFLQDSF